MDAWKILFNNSTAPDGSDAWTHLNNQNSGSGEPGEGETVCLASSVFKSSLVETTTGHTVNTGTQSTLVVESDTQIDIDNNIITTTEINENG